MKKANMDSQQSLMDAASTARKETSSVRTEYIEGTPFAVRGIENDWYCMWGKYVISPKMPTFDTAKALIDEKDWTILHNMCSIIAHSVYNEGLANLTENIEQVINQKKVTNE